MLTGNLRAVHILLGHKSGRTTEIYSHLADRYLQAAVNLLPSSNLGTTVILPGRGMTQVVDKLIINWFFGSAGCGRIFAFVIPSNHRKEA
jgi:hypothetical protein